MDVVFESDATCNDFAIGGDFNSWLGFLLRVATARCHCEQHHFVARHARVGFDWSVDVARALASARCQRAHTRLGRNYQQHSFASIWKHVTSSYSINDGTSGNLIIYFKNIFLKIFFFLYFQPKKSVFNNREAATLEKFNKEYCNTLKQLSIERCVPVSQRVAEPVLRPCQLQPVVPRLFARFDVYAYNERVRLSLLPYVVEFEFVFSWLILIWYWKQIRYVNALRDIATSALYVPMFFFCIFALMVILKKVVILAFAQ